MKKQAVRNSPRLGHLPMISKIRALSPRNIKKKSTRDLSHSRSPVRKAAPPAPVADTELKRKLRRLSPSLLQQEFKDNKTQIYESECRSKAWWGLHVPVVVRFEAVCSTCAHTRHHTRAKSPVAQHHLAARQ